MRCFTAAAVLLALACRCPADDKEPVYQDKPLSAWVEQLSDPSPTARQEAAEVLSKIGPSAKSALGPLVAALGDTDGVVRDAAAVALASFRKDAVPPLVAALKAHDPAVRRGAASALSFIGADAHDAVGPLIAALKEDDDPDVRERVAYALGSFGPAAKDAIEPLAAAAVGKDAGLHGPALMALGGVGKPAVPTLVRSLQNKALDIRQTAPLALALIGRGAKEAVGPLIALSKDDDVEVRFGAVSALGAIASDPKVSVPALIAALNDMKTKIRRRPPSRWGGTAAMRPTPYRR